MLKKRVSLINQKTNFLEFPSNFTEKDNIYHFREKAEYKDFKTPEKKQQITIDNGNTTVTITNYFHHSKSSYLKENKDKVLYDLKGLEKKLNFEEAKDNNFTLQKKSKYTSNSPQTKKQLSITFSDLKKNGFNLRPKRFHSSKKSMINNSIHGSFCGKSSRNSIKLNSSDSFSKNDSVENLYESSKSDEESDASIDSNLCCNHCIPHKKINDENYKIIALKQLRKIEIPHVKSVNCKFYEYKRRPYEFDGNVTKFCEFYNLKRRKVSSTKKIYQGYGEFVDQDSNKKMLFCFFEDQEVGFSREWQKKLVTTEMDDDIKTDDEQLILAKKHIFKELKDGFTNFRKINMNRKISLL